MQKHLTHQEKSGVVSIRELTDLSQGLCYERKGPQERQKFPRAFVLKPKGKVISDIP